MTIDWSDPAARNRLIERVGPDAHRSHCQHIIVTTTTRMGGEHHVADGRRPIPGGHHVIALIYPKKGDGSGAGRLGGIERRSRLLADQPLHLRKSRGARATTTLERSTGEGACSVGCCDLAVGLCTRAPRNTGIAANTGSMSLTTWSGRSGLYRNWPQ
jgi:hypothetical protein